MAAKDAKEKVLRVRITLEYSNPPIWREVAVLPDITLGELHRVIQIVMGWDDDHLHQFIQKLKRSTRPSREEQERYYQSGNWNDDFEARIHGRKFFVPKTAPDGTPIDMEGPDEDAVLLAEVCPNASAKLIYEYDFGDSWNHEIKVKRAGLPEPGVEYPICLGGERACPPEDCGGIWDYYSILEAVSDPDNEQHENMAYWLDEGFDPDAFDLDKINAKLARWRNRR